MIELFPQPAVELTQQGIPALRPGPDRSVRATHTLERLLRKASLPPAIKAGYLPARTKAPVAALTTQMPFLSAWLFPKITCHSRSLCFASQSSR